MKRPFDRWSMVSAVWASIEGWRRTVSTTQVAIGTCLVITATAAATASAWTCRCGEGEVVARSVNSGVQIESGQKLTMWSGSQTEWYRPLSSSSSWEKSNGSVVRRNAEGMKLISTLASKIGALI